MTICIELWVNLFSKLLFRLGFKSGDILHPIYTTHYRLYNRGNRVQGNVSLR